jgi:hypothetical protein
LHAWIDLRRIHQHFSTTAQLQKEDIHILDATTKLSCDVALTMSKCYTIER